MKTPKWATEVTKKLPRNRTGHPLLNSSSPPLKVGDALVGFIRLLSWAVRILLGSAGACRFVPTCSEYAAEVIQKKGVLTGLGRVARRICRCHPFSPGGLDLP